MTNVKHFNTKIVFGLLLSTFRRSMTEVCSNENMAETACSTKGVYSMAYVTVPNSNNVGKGLAHKIIKSKLAACVNIVPQVTSVYEWENKINEDSEELLIIKTRTSRVNELIAFVKENHPYTVCEVISVPIDNGNPPYLKWIGDIVPPQK